MAVKEIILPKLGQTMETGAIEEWVAKEGDEINRGDVLFTVESDKAVLEHESTARGYLRKILVPAGEEVPVMTVVAIITREADEDISDYVASHEGGAAAPPAAEEEAEPESESEETPAKPKIESPERPEGRIFASPRARMRAEELGVPLEPIRGSGPNGRIVEADVFAYAESLEAIDATPAARRLAQSEGVDLSQVAGSGQDGKVTVDDVRAFIKAKSAEPSGEPEEAAVPASAPVTGRTAEVGEPAPAAQQPALKGVRGIIADRMHTSHVTTARVTLTMEVDATAFVKVREQLRDALKDQLGFNVGYNDLLCKICARALVEFPNVNSRLQGDEIVPVDVVNVGMAVDTERGLLVPTIKDADKKGVAEIATDFRALVARVREGKAGPDDLTGGTFTITNLGMYEVDAFTPIINLPEVAILGVGRIKEQPVVVDGEIVVRKMMWLSLTFDHRIIDGAPAARFLQRIKQMVEQPYLVLA
jgi:pyruvate dehydrogenase E2 component (dihydrolipoamide acetyltransferase)